MGGVSTGRRAPRFPLPSLRGSGSALARGGSLCMPCFCRFAPSLRQLKQQALLLHFPPTLPSRLTQRLQEVCDGCPASAIHLWPPSCSQDVGWRSWASLFSGCGWF